MFVFFILFIFLGFFVHQLYLFALIILIIAICFGTQPHTRPYRLAKRIES